MASWTEIEYMRTVNQTFYDQVKTADQKAGYVCTFLTILLAYSKDKEHVLMFLNARPSFSLLWILSVLFALAACFAIVCTALIILPRSKAGGASLYWGAWSDANATGQKFAGEIPDDLIKSEYLNNVKNLAHICQVK